MGCRIDLPLARRRNGQTRRVKALTLRMGVGFVAALLLLLTFARLVNLGSVLARLQRLSLVPALLCGAAFLCAYVVRALRWRRILAPYPVSISRAVAIYQVATFVNWLLPIRGGELVKSLLLKRLNDIPISGSLPTVAMDKTMDLLPAIILVALLPVMPFELSRPLWVMLLTVLLLLALGAMFLVFAAWQRPRALALLSWMTSKLPGDARRHIGPSLVHFVDALLALVMRPRLLLVATLYTAVAVLFDAVFCLLAFLAIGATLPFPVILYGYTFYNLAYILPTPPGQIGSNELVGLLVFAGLFRINRSVVAAMFLFAHPWTALLMVCSGLLCLSAMGLSLGSTLAMARVPSSSPQTPPMPETATHA